MGAFKTRVQQMKDWFQGLPEVNEVSFGDASMIDTSSRTSFPLVHIIPISSTYENNIGAHVFQIIIVSTNHTGDEVIDTLDLTNQIAGEFVAYASSSIVFGTLSKVSAVPAQTLYDKFKNRLYGYNLTFELRFPTELPNC